MSGARPLSGRPLYANAADNRLYVEQEDVDRRVERAIDRGLNVLVSGERGAGKTSLLQHLLFRARKDPARSRTVYIDASIARTPIDIIDLVREALGVAHNLGETVASGLIAFNHPKAAGARDSMLLLQRLVPLRDVDPGVVLLDGLGADDIAHTLFGRLRDELWTLPHTWVVATSPAQRSQFSTPPADAFFEMVVELAPFDVESQVELLARRLPEEWTALETLAGNARGNPRQLLATAREVLVEGRRIGDVLSADATRRSRLEALGAAATRMHEELQSIGYPVAASDDELLRRLGITRERATQVLNALLASGLVESFQEPADRGRPRKLYRIRERVADDDSR
jgi:energy-coupling factor transporter ATP-binding protein EcfA2